MVLVIVIVVDGVAVAVLLPREVVVAVEAVGLELGGRKDGLVENLAGIVEKLGVVVLGVPDIGEIVFRVVGVGLENTKERSVGPRGLPRVSRVRSDSVAL